MYKYLPCLLPTDSVSAGMRLLADRIAEETDTHSPLLWSPPHITLHRPVIAEEEEVRNCLAHVAAHAQQSNICFSGTLDCFKGEEAEYFVLPAQTPWRVASLWVGVHKAFRHLPGYERAKTDGSTMLHATLAEVTKEISERTWPKVRNFWTEPMVMPVTRIDLLRKLVRGGNWEMVHRFPIPA